MLQKFKITSCAFILVLFGFSLMTVSPVLAHNAVAFDEGDHTYEYEEAAVDDAEGCKEALKLGQSLVEEISASLKDKDATIADLQNQLSTAHSESEAQVDLIADLKWQLATAIALGGEAQTGLCLDEMVGRIETSCGLWSDEAREHCSTSSNCREHLKQFTAKHELLYDARYVSDYLYSKFTGYNGDKWEVVFPEHYRTLQKIPYWLESAYANTIPHSAADIIDTIIVDCGAHRIDSDCLADQADRAAALVLSLGNKVKCDNLPLCD
jgi:hypothetical protein